jgi:hypothetical protein
MKIVITESQFNIIRREFDEIVTREKKYIGIGTMHTVYPSNGNPDLVYKVGSHSDIEHFANLFKTNTNIFPIVHKIGYIIKGNKKYTYVALEKLDTKKAEKDWDILSWSVTDCTDWGWSSFGSYVIQYIFKCQGDEYNEDTVNWVDKYVEDEHPHIKGILDRFKYIIEEVVKIHREPDLHKYNFGYTKDGMLKCLDI